MNAGDARRANLIHLKLKKALDDQSNALDSLVEALEAYGDYLTDEVKRLRDQGNIHNPQSGCYWHADGSLRHTNVCTCDELERDYTNV